MKLLSATFALMLSTTALAQAVVTPPPGVVPGDSYRVLFVTNGTISAASSNIADYDAFAAAQAAAVPGLLALGTGWRALASTTTVGAAVHTGTTWSAAAPGVPIYGPHGVLVAEDYAQLWSTTGAPLADAPWSPWLNGNPQPGLQVWTGTLPDGSAAARPLGALAGSARIGVPTSTGPSWTSDNEASTALALRIYAISDVIVHDAVRAPEGLQPGERYRVLFPTDTLTSAVSAQISTYDQVATQDANAVPQLAALGTTWQALVSTNSVSARDHTGTTWTAADAGLPVFRPDGKRIADNYRQLWSVPTMGALHNPPNRSGSGQQVGFYVLTGTRANGTADPGFELGSGSFVRSGNPGTTATAAWVASTTATGPGSTQPIYVISAVLTVPYPATQTLRAGTVPNPMAFVTTNTPVRGTTWQPIVDHSTFATNAALDFGFLGTAQLDVPVPGFGTVLVDQVLGTLTAWPGLPLELAIPANPALSGAQLTMQAISLDYAWQLHVANAIDFTIGDY